MSVVVLARTGDGRAVAMVLSDPLTDEDMRRLSAIAAMPGLSTAEWSATPGTSSR